jgi:undecaprenyl-diphosphatase
VVGYAGLVWIALAAPVARLARRQIGFSVVLTAACVWTADLITLALKAAIGRPRPFETIPHTDPLIKATIGQSMPSGHAATSFAGAVILAYFLPRWAPLFFLLATAIAFSRVYVGVHYLSDIAVGALIGAAVGVTFLAGLRLLPRSEASRRRSEGVPPEG